MIRRAVAGSFVFVFVRGRAPIRRAVILAALLTLGLFVGIAAARAEQPPIAGGTISESVTVMTVTVTVNP